MKKRLASIALALTLCIGMMPTAAWAEDDGISVQNIQGIAEKETMFSADWIVGTNNDGSVKKEPRQTSDDCIITADKTVWDKNANYFVKGDITIDNYVRVEGNVSLCLYDGATLRIYGSVKISGAGGLTIYGQSTGKDAGQMIVYDQGGNAFELASGSTASICMTSGRLQATGKDGALGEKVEEIKHFQNIRL